MDFLKDNKNTPIVIAILVLAIGGSVFSFFHFYLGSERQASSMSSAQIQALRERKQQMAVAARAANQHPAAPQ